ncbi:MAG: glycosyltransferase [Agathobacter sp.]|nr:glycosyltransferase [Agathobacter sp.]
MDISKVLQHITFNNIKRGTKYLLKNGPKAVVSKTRAVVKSWNRYDPWFKHHRITEAELEEQRQHVFEYQPKISILVPTYKTPIPMLHEMMASVIGQSYTNWELCIADGTMEDGELKAVLQEYAAKDARIKVRFLDSNDGISGNTNKALELATGEFIGLLDHDDILELDALYEVVKVLQDKTVDLVYTDEDKVSEDLSEFRDPNLKPDFSIDLLRSHNYITHFLVIKKTIIDKVGPFNSKYDGAQDYDLVLRSSEAAQHIEHVAKPLYHWRMSAGSTAENPESKLYCYEAGRAAVEAHLERCGIKGRVELAGQKLWGLNHVTYDVVGNPLVSIVIANKDHTKDLDKAITSIQEKSTYRNIEFIVVENNSTDKKTFAYYEKIQKKYDNVKVVYWDREFNYSLINNFGVEHAKGEYILLLNNDTEMITPTAIEEMLGICCREDVGIVGAKLLYADKTIQHAGVVLGFGGYAGHVFHGIGRYDLGFMMRPRINCNYSAVTAACLLTKRSVYEAVGGLTEEFVVAGNDIDYCLKVRETGLLVVYSAWAEWFHYESKSRGYEDTPEKKARFDGEVAKFRKRWGHLIDAGDPFYNKNFPVTVAPFQFDMKGIDDK